MPLVLHIYRFVHRILRFLFNTFFPFVLRYVRNEEGNIRKKKIKKVLCTPL